MNRRVINCFLLSLFLFLFSSHTLNAAGSFTLGFSGPSNATTGDTISVQVVIRNMSEGVSGVGATLNYDKSLLELVDKNSGNAMSISYNNSNSAKFMGVSMGGSVSSTSTLVTYKFKTLKPGTASITFTDVTSTNVNYESMSVSKDTYRVTIKAPLSGNANLGSLSVPGTSISTSNMTANVGKDTSSITINASAEDSGATVSGTGTKSLNYGKNTFTITVKAPSGATKNYTITINREDPRSNNANLSSLKVSGGDLTPGFNKNTTTYSMTVPFSVSSLDIKANAEDSKAKVSISGNNNLPAEATTRVLVTVTAENGSTKVYAINVTREKDPNKPKSNNNYLTTIATNIGLLSPVFDKEKTNYVIYLPYEIDKIELTVDVEDKEYGKLETIAPESLNVGTNRYEFKVTAEDGSVRSYIVNVIRGANLDGSSNNVLLNDIKIENGSLDKKFNSKINIYKYDKKKNFKLTPIPEDENTKITVLEHDEVYTILLESSNGDVNVYTLIPKEEPTVSNNLGIVIAVALASLPIIGCGTFLGYKFGMKKMLSKVKSLAQNTKTIQNDNVVYDEKPKTNKPKKNKKKLKETDKQE